MPAVVQGLKSLQRPLKGFGLRDLGKDEKNSGTSRLSPLRNWGGIPVPSGSYNYTGDKH